VSGREQPPVELMKALMKPEDFAAWERQQAASREFWRTLKGPAQRPLGSNADEWHLFLAENKEALPYLAVQIAEAIEEAERRGPRAVCKHNPCACVDAGITTGAAACDFAGR
jgi:hypothetical protein